MKNAKAQKLNTKNAKLYLKDGSEYSGRNFGTDISVSGEVVFATGMTGYPEALTDPSFRGQILVFTYPLIGNYGVPKKELWESEKIQVSGLIVCDYSETPSHHESVMSLAEWFKKEKLPLLEIKDTRGITEKIREEGAMLGKIISSGKKVKLEDPNKRNLAGEVSIKKPRVAGKGKKTVALIDCGTKKNIERCLLARGVKVITVPWDTDVTKMPIDAVVISNGPGDPTKAKKTVNNVRKVLNKKIPALGICLGNQILTLAAGGTTYKMKFGHRSQNQPAVEMTGTEFVGPARGGFGRAAGGPKCFLTTQNHGFAVKKIPKGFQEWFRNANDGTNEGIIHRSLPLMSVQFHPESTPGPMDTEWIFDYFLSRAGIKTRKNKKS